MTIQVFTTELEVLFLEELVLMTAPLGRWLLAGHEFAIFGPKFFVR